MSSNCHDCEKANSEIAALKERLRNYLDCEYESQVEALKAELEELKSLDDANWNEVCGVIGMVGLKAKVKNLEADRDSLLAAMGEKDKALSGLIESSTAEANEKGLGGYHAARLSDARLALSTTPQDALARLTERIRAEAFREAAILVSGDGGCRTFLSAWGPESQASGKREG